MRIAIDAGHGSLPGKPTTGASANGIAEDLIAMDMARRIGHHLRLAGHRTVYTRPTSKLVPLMTRSRKAISSKCGALVSIHCNAGPAQAKGVEAFAAQGDCRGRKLAESICIAAASLGLRNRGAKWDNESAHARLTLLRATSGSMPAVLVELCFLTNKLDAMLISDRRFRERMAVAIARCF